MGWPAILLVCLLLILLLAAAVVGALWWSRGLSMSQQALVWGAILVFLLSTLYTKFWAYLTTIFGPSMWLYAGLFFFESFTLYLYYYGWDRWKYGRAKLVHWTLGILLNVWGTIVMLIANSWLTYMMTPPRDISSTTDPSTIKLWHAIANATWMPINVHRLIANVVFGGAMLARYVSLLSAVGCIRPIVACGSWLREGHQNH